jgi:hypothetical protein
MALVGAVERPVGGPRYTELREFDLDTDMEVAVRTIGLLRVESVLVARPLPFTSTFGWTPGIGTIGKKGAKEGPSGSASSLQLNEGKEW